MGKGFTMNKQVRTCLFFFLPFLLFFCLMILLNGQTQTLQDGNMIPDSENGFAYSLPVFSQDRYELDEEMTVENQYSGNLSFLLSSMGEYTLYVNGREVQTGRFVSDPFSQFSIVNLPSQKGPLSIRFIISGKDNRTPEILTGRLNSPPKVLLTTEENALRYSQISFGGAMLMIGIYVAIMTECLIMYFSRRQEKSFLMTAAVAFVQLLTSFFLVRQDHIFISQQMYSYLRPVLAVLPIVFHVSIGVYLLWDCLSAGIRKLCSIRNIIILTFVMSVLQLISSRSFYHLFHLLAYLFLLSLIRKGFEKESPGVNILAAGYGISAATILFVYLVYIWALMPAGIMFTIFRTTTIGYLFSLSASMVVITRRLISKFKETEILVSQITDLNTALDRKVEERTAQLVSSQKQRQNMILAIFHDLRSPVFVLRGTMERIRPSDAGQIKLKSQALARIDNLSRLIEDLFLTEKLENGKEQIICETVDLSELLQDVIEEARLKSAGFAEISGEVEKGICFWGDELRIRQVINNIIDNALRHIPKNGSVHISLHRNAANAVITVRDNGSGIIPEVMPHIFDCYYSGNRDGHSGLGLYIAKQLVALHGGSIAAYSEPDVMTEFTVMLPMNMTGCAPGGEKDDQNAFDRRRP